MITEDLDKYEDLLREIDEELANNSRSYPVEYIKNMWAGWNTNVKYYYAQQLHCNVDDMIQRLDSQQHKCCSCAKRFEYDSRFAPVLGRLKTNMPFTAANIRFRCPKCCEQNGVTHANKLDMIPSLCCAPEGEK